MNTLLRKYPRTPHLPHSEGMTDDDKMATPETIERLKSGIELVVTEKMDGSNITMYRNDFHGRSLDSGTHPWDTRARALWASVRFMIPDGWRLSGESMQARRSVAYDNLPGVYMLFGVWDDTNTLISWDETEAFAEATGLPLVPVLYRGKNYDDAISVWAKNFNSDHSEGYVVRDAGTIPYTSFGDHIAKMVRANHVRTRADWRHRDDFAENTFR